MDTPVVVGLILIGICWISLDNVMKSSKERKRRAWLNAHGEVVAAKVTQCKKVSSGYWHYLSYSSTSIYINTSYTEFAAYWNDWQSDRTYTFFDQKAPISYYQTFKEGDLVILVFDPFNRANFYIKTCRELRSDPLCKSLWLSHEQS